MEAARHEFKLSRRGEDGVTLREKAEFLGKPTTGPAIPTPLEHVWAWFQDLNRGRGGNGFGANPLSWADIKAWMDLTGARPSPWEISLLKNLDLIYLEVLNG